MRLGMGDDLAEDGGGEVIQSRQPVPLEGFVYRQHGFRRWFPCRRRGFLLTGAGREEKDSRNEAIKSVHFDDGLK